jgi:hypothetical protein
MSVSTLRGAYNGRVARLPSARHVWRPFGPRAQYISVLDKDKASLDPLRMLSLVTYLLREGTSPSLQRMLSLPNKRSCLSSASTIND